MAPEVGFEPTAKRLTATRSIVKIQGGSQIVSLLSESPGNN
jgi:hypothetical protein